MKWIGRGVLRVDGKDYDYGDEIPTKGISPERIAQLKARGKIGEIPVAGPNPEIVKLNSQIDDLKSINECLVSELNVANKELARVQKELSQVNTELEELKAQNGDDKPDKPGEKDAAGPKGDKKK